MDDGVSEGPKRKRAKSKKDVSTEKDGSEGKRADEILGKRLKEENNEKIGNQGMLLSPTVRYCSARIRSVLCFQTPCQQWQHTCVAMLAQRDA